MVGKGGISVSQTSILIPYRHPIVEDVNNDTNLNKRTLMVYHGEISFQEYISEGIFYRSSTGILVYKLWKGQRPSEFRLIGLETS